MVKGRSTPRRSEVRLAQLGRMLSLLILCESLEAAPLITRLVQVVRRLENAGVANVSEPAEPLRGCQVGDVGVDGNFGGSRGDAGSAFACCSKIGVG